MPATSRVAWAAAALRWRCADALPALRLESGPQGSPDHWGVQRNLLDSKAEDRHFVLEAENDGSARLRFAPATQLAHPQHAQIDASIVGQSFASGQLSLKARDYRLQPLPLPPADAPSAT